VALPEASRFTAPGFEHYAPAATDVDGCRVLVFLGTLFGQTSPVTMHSPLVGAEVTLPAGRSLEVDLDVAYEHGFLCDTGTLTVQGATAKPGEIVFLPAGAQRVTLTAGDDATRLLVLGGTPFGEQIVMWWNFIGRSHDEVVGFREQWQREREAAARGEAADASARYGTFPDAWDHTLPAPGLPNLRLRSRG
jgi:redox-sensitive bicupin YhaK (pirin superfamily)